MKTQLSAVVVTVLAMSANAFAIYDPKYERPLYRADDMEITDARYGFKDVEEVDLTLTKRDGKRRPTGMILSMEVRHSNRPEHKQLVITDISKDDCGSTVYVASLPQKKGSDKGMGARFHVTLVDHSTRMCHDYKANLWEASVREGYGWCGTMDATMELEGNPQPVYTIQAVR